jgi:proteasome lid subunit RPN8/RPN11
MIQLPRTIVNQILAHAQRFPEQEICGLIGADAGQPLHSYPVDNSDAQPRSRFTMDPKQQIDAMRKMRDSGEELFAIYHSHPHTPAMPSVTDLEQAAYPEAHYLIVSLNTEGVLEMRAFRLKGGEMESEDIEVVA